MRPCSSCGSQVLESATFCPACGDTLARPCPACGSPVAPSARFCPTCGAALAPVEAIRDPFESARTGEMLAGLIEVGDREALLAAALSAHEEIGARLHAERVRRELEGDPLERAAE